MHGTKREAEVVWAELVADLDRFYASLRGPLQPASIRKVHTILRSVAPGL